MFKSASPASGQTIFDGNGYYIVAMTDIATRLITADMMLTPAVPTYAAGAAGDPQRPLKVAPVRRHHGAGGLHLRRQ